jgi:alkanesulfonate monooxygenase SsuD/methylene tetrahydromethanopterin reductase-like flavin-dependent oxidoreductase (luciferase family)
LKFGLQHPNFSFDYDDQSSNNANSSQIADSLKNLITKAENSGFDSFWVMDHFPEAPTVVA